MDGNYQSLSGWKLVALVLAAGAISSLLLLAFPGNLTIGLLVVLASTLITFDILRRRRR